MDGSQATEASGVDPRNRVRTSGVLFSSKDIPSINFKSCPKSNSPLPFGWSEVQVTNLESN